MERKTGTDRQVDGRGEKYGKVNGRFLQMFSESVYTGEHKPRL